MERPERYAPEDIEHLMLERGFDELLAEEKAYVLRHLESAADYTRMRALLLHMQEEGSRQPPVDADPAVREHVLQAFREQQRPQWRIWLNSVAAFMAPARPVHYWRPALALGVVTLLITGSLSVWQAIHRSEKGMVASLKETEVQTPPRPAEVSAPPTGTAHGATEAATEQTEMPAPAPRQAVPAPAPPTAALADIAVRSAGAAPPMDSSWSSSATALMEVAAETIAADQDHMDDAVFAKAEKVDATARKHAPATLMAAPSESDLLGLLRAAW
ncbi:MAG TPA: hypothetical protein PKD45_11270 [Flavobacteriales bacterium]|nr:hypothetical protein [Flavobacteriales bacterium]